MKGIILAGGSGTRLYPLTLATSKQLMPVYDKPMIYYPLSVLMLAGITEILFITTASDLPQFQRLLGEGSQWGLSFRYAVQPRPEGLAQAYLIGADFLKGKLQRLSSAIISFTAMDCQTCWPWDISGWQALPFLPIASMIPSATVSSNLTRAAAHYPLKRSPLPRSNWAVTGLYFCDERVIDIAANLKPSGRGELEIADVISAYLTWDQLDVRRMGRGFAWFDMGTHDSLMEASMFVQTLEKRQGLRIACPEEIAYDQGFITHEEFVALEKNSRKAPTGNIF